MSLEPRKQVLFIQGGGPDVHDAWDDKMARSLQNALGDDYAVLYPRMPNEADPRYSDWCEALRKAFGNLTDGAFVVGHSIGGAILIHALAELTPETRLGGLFLIAAPFIGHGGWSSEEMVPRTDFAERLTASLPVFLYHGTADKSVPVEHLSLYAGVLPDAILRRLQGRDHQLDNDLREVAEDVRALDQRTHPR